MLSDELVVYINDNNMSEGYQMYTQSQLGEDLSSNLTDIKNSFMGDPNTTVSPNSPNNYPNQIDWSQGNDAPLPQGDSLCFTYLVIAVINYIAGVEQGQSDTTKIQKEEAARSTWSNELNATSSLTDLATSPFNTMMQDTQGDLNNTQSAMQAFGSLSSVVGTLAGLVAQFQVVA